MEKVELYRHIPPSVRTIPVEVAHIPVEDSITGEAEIAESFKRLFLNRLGGP